MTRMPDIAAEAEAAAVRHRRPSFTPEETVPVTSPVASAMAAVEHAAAMLNEIRSSKLAVALHDEGLGGLLPDSDIAHVVAIVRSLELPHRQAQANLPHRQANGNGTRQSGPQQSVTA
jgi:hypothetical protein